MGKSQETWNKKEKEKKNQKRKQDKEEKKQERKANAKSGAKLEDMFAYVDEFGNITNTPPDPTKKKAVKLEDISISIPKHDPNAVVDEVRTGFVTFYNDQKGYGFIRDKNTQESIFVHANGLIDQIKENNKVSFEIGSGPKGPTAIKVKLIT